MTANDRPVVTRKGHEHGNTAQSGGLKLMTGVGPQHTPATRIWFGKASNPPGLPLVAAPSWRGRNRRLSAFRPRPHLLRQELPGLRRDVGGGFFLVRLHPHLEANMSTTEELWWLACRTPENIVVNLPDIEDALLAGYRRA